MAAFGMLLLAVSWASLAVGVEGQGNSCPCAQTSSCVTCGAQPGCANVSTAPFNIMDAVLESPYYEAASTKNILYKNIDNTCITFYEIDNNSALIFRSIVFINGSYIVQKYIVAAVEQCPGSFRIQGLFSDSGCSSFVDQQCVLGEACEGTFVVYRCNLYKGSDEIVLPVTDNRIVFSNNRTLTPGCYQRAVAIGDSQNFNYYGWAQAPNRFPARCVTRFNGATCINYQNVAPGDQISLPPRTCSCTDA